MDTFEVKCFVELDETAEPVYKEFRVATDAELPALASYVVERPEVFELCTDAQSETAIVVIVSIAVVSDDLITYEISGEQIDATLQDEDDDEDAVEDEESDSVKVH